MGRSLFLLGYNMQVCCRLAPREPGTECSVNETEVRDVIKELNFDGVILPIESPEPAVVRETMHHHLHQTMDFSIRDDLLVGGIRTFMSIGARRSGRGLTLFGKGDHVGPSWIDRNE